MVNCGGRSPLAAGWILPLANVIGGEATNLRRFVLGDSLFLDGRSELRHLAFQLLHLALQLGVFRLGLVQ